MGKRLLLNVALVSALFAPTLALADTPAWYDIKFSASDVWKHSADNASQSRSDQNAPRRYATYDTGSRVLQDTTYGVNGLSTTGFGAWASTSGFAFDSINLWGAGATGDWNEIYTSVGTGGSCPGCSSWQIIKSPTGWSSGIVKGGDSWSADATHAFPVWRSSGTADMLGIGASDSAFQFEVLVLISNPSTAFDSSGKLRVFFGGFNDDTQMTGPDNHEVSGVMLLSANPVPEPETYAMMLAGLSLLGFIARRRKQREAA